MRWVRAVLALLVGAVLIAVFVVVFQASQRSREDERALAAYAQAAADLRSVPRPEGLRTALVIEDRGGCADSSIGEEGGGPGGSVDLSGDAQAVVQSYADALQARGWKPQPRADGRVVTDDELPDRFTATLERTIDGFEVTVLVSAGSVDLGFPGTTIRDLVIGTSINHTFCS